MSSMRILCAPSLNDDQHIASIDKVCGGAMST